MPVKAAARESARSEVESAAAGAGAGASETASKEEEGCAGGGGLEIEETGELEDNTSDVHVEAGREREIGVEPVLGWMER